jgi:hypothetical protein
MRFAIRHFILLVYPTHRGISYPAYVTFVSYIIG